ncbi:MAG: exodeoxyribonuclease VII small subunit [Alcaligenes sp.]
MVKSRDDNQAAGEPAAGVPAADVSAEQDFESALAQLEALVARMESGSLPLEQALQAYEQGVELAKFCQRKLDVAQEQVSVLQGNLLRPLSGDEADGDI